MLCQDDVECALGESCLEGACAFTGCSGDEECGTGRCRKEVYACTECGKSSDCHRDRPVCDPVPGRCVQCQTDADCRQGPGYCQRSTGACAYCLKDEHCPNGLRCGTDGVCHGAPKGASCSQAVACDLGLMCVSINSQPSCQKTCGLYAPSCPSGELCLRLTFQDSNSLVFERGEPLGVCAPPLPGLKGYREACTRSSQGNNCQPNLECVPDSSQRALCRGFCDPNLQTCPMGETCHRFPGDFAGHQYGLCYPENGYGEPCQKDAQCRPGLSCTPGDDPSASENLSHFCHFSVGSAPALAPCAGQLLPDGGAAPPDAVCQSGACRGDRTFSTPSFFCYGACATDQDCQVGGRAGTCDGKFEFSGTGVVGTLTGCRPACGAPAHCAEYGTRFTCRVQLQSSYLPKLSQSCAPQPGTAGLGESCSQHLQCRSGYCVLEDGRGVPRQGYCAHPCTRAQDCASADGLDGGPGAGTALGPLSCEEIALLGFRGWDGAPNTSDDLHLLARHCAGKSCLTDQDCAPGRCVPEPAASNPLGELVLRCRPPHRTGSLEAGSPCAFDSDCASGACANLSGGAKTCFTPCDSATSCPGSTLCQDGGVWLASPNGSLQLFRACAP